MIKVAIDTSPLSSAHKVRGIGVQTREVIRELKKVKSQGIKLYFVDFGKADLTKYDIVHYQYFHPFFQSIPDTFPTKAIVTIDDLIPLVYPDHYPPGIRGKIRFWKQKGLLRKAKAIITISEGSKEDIHDYLGIKKNKIFVTYLAQKNVFKRVADKRLLERTRKKYELPKKFVLFIGDVNYNKNINNLIKACSRIGISLVLVGKNAKDIDEAGIDMRFLEGPRDWVRYLFGKPHPELAHYRQLMKNIKESKCKVIRPGFVPDEDIASVFSLASVYCQPSYYEGFGLPVLEAMACGIPVVTTKGKPLPEIAGDAAVYASNFSSGSLARAIEKVLRKEKLRNQIVEKGYERVKIFSWEKTAEETLEVYKKVAGSM